MFNTTKLERRVWVLAQMVFSVAMIVVTKKILAGDVGRCMRNTLLVAL